MDDVLRRLAEIDAGELPLLSIYLDVRPEATGERPALREGLIVLKDRLHEIRKTFLPRGASLDSFDQDAKRVNSFVETEMASSTAGLAIFACGGMGLFESIEAAAPFDNQVTVDRHADLFQLARLNEELETAVVAVVDSNTARVFAYRHARLKEVEVRDEDSTHFQKRSTGGWSQARYQRHIDKHRQDFAREMAGSIEQIIATERAEHLILAGDEVAITPLRNALSADALGKLKDVLRIDIRAPRDAIAREVAPLLKAAERESGAAIVDQLVAEIRRGRLGVAGIAATSTALDRGQVDVLVIDGGANQDTEVRGNLVRRALLTGADLETVEGSAALGEFGGVGALLRYTD
jgi:peptide chain release factor subunit 1